MGHRIILLGIQGSGKGTQAQRLSGLLHVPHVSTGQLLWEAMSSQTVLGQQISAKMDSGTLVSDTEIDDLLRERLSQADCQNGWLLDGYPRRLTQAITLSQSFPPTMALHLQLGEDSARQRLFTRLICPQGHAYNSVYRPPRVDDLCDDDGLPLKRRSDETPEGIDRRFQMFREETLPVVRYYQEQRILHDVDASQSVGAVTRAILRHIAVTQTETT